MAAFSATSGTVHGQAGAVPFAHRSPLGLHAQVPGERTNQLYAKTIAPLRGGADHTARESERLYEEGAAVLVQELCIVGSE